MSSRFFFLCLFALLVGEASAQSFRMDCKDPRGDNVEKGLIAGLAPGVVTRVSEHRLRVRSASGTQDFVDEPPHDEPFGGVHYYFCDRKEGWILLMKLDQTLSTGTLVNEATGKITPGGETVLFSQDKRAYLVSEQPNGMDGNTWAIYATDGRQSWSGYNFIVGQGPNLTAHAYLSEPTWTATGELIAQATCTMNLEITWRAKLVKKDGEWNWQPKKPCPAPRRK
ncbi:hypothetical protein AACH06_21280 [Ideonella sp. DXS29W]|uniref:Uncharacterized protein n=1 Tax=Ideonella lacteola TaxID=2984193 RepID=A0ABU9BW55_9BURK